MPNLIIGLARGSRRLLVVALAVVGSVAGTAPEGGRERGNAVLHWNRIATEIFPIEVGPVVDSRAMAILHAAIHDAVNGIVRRYEPYTADVLLPGASLEAAVATAAHDVMVAMAPGQAQRIAQEYAAALANVDDGPAKDSGVSLGHEAARANLARRADDGIAPGPWPPQEGPITEPVYSPTGAPGDYDFTPPFDAPPLGPVALFPGFGRLAPFAIDLARHRPAGPDPLRSSRYARDVNLVKSLGSLTSVTRKPDQTATAFFWFEPFAIWNDIARTVIRRHQLDPWRAARVLALMNFAMADSEIAGFDAKYRFRFWRPYTAIRRAAEDGNDATDEDVEWLPLLWTPADMPPTFVIPPIPDYPSAAAVTSAAAAEVLTVHLGRHTRFDATSVTLPGAVRRFRNFRHAAHEAGWSRVFGGIHFVHAVEDGFKQGTGIGRDVSRLLPRAHR
jgi:hypothetical protein